MLRSGAACIAYETVERADRSLPLLVPMSEVAGRMAVQEGAKYLEKPMEGRGILLAGIPGVAPATVVVIGGGVVAPTPRGSPRGWAPSSTCSTSTSTGCATCPRSCRPTSSR